MYGIKVERFYANLLESVGRNFMSSNTALYDFQVENLVQADEGFLTSNERFSDYLDKEKRGKSA